MATSTTSVSGLVSGLDTSTIISQLMQLEAQPQTALKTTLTNTQTAVTSYQSLNTKFQALLTAAQKVQTPATWGARTAASSDSSVAASATAGALGGSVTFTVNQLASAHSLISGSSTASLSDPGTFTLTGGTFQIVAHDGTTTDITPTDGSLQSVVAAVNSSGAGVRAAAVQVAPGQYRLQLTSTTTGSTSDFTVQGLGGLGGTSIVNQGGDASIHVGSPSAGFDVVSSSNTFTEVQPGLTFTVSKADITTTVSVANDQDSIAGSVQSLVDAANAVLSEISKQTAMGTVNADGSRAGQGALAGDTTIKAMTSTVLQAVTSAVGTTSAAKYGIQSTRDGALTFDKTVFTAAYNASPDDARATLAPITGTGVAQRLQVVADRASNSTTGTITSTITSKNSMINDLNHQISDWDVRLAARQETLQNQFTAMEVALQKLQSQASWLNGQISALNANNGSKLVMSPATSAARYVQDSINTASPGRLLVMLYDRLALDLARAADALSVGDRSAAHPLLLHAQDIVSELEPSLDHSAGWAASKSLAALYTWLGWEIVQVNVLGDVERLRACQSVVEPLRESWHSAFEATSAASADARMVG